jgi:hypothetical protein
MNEPKIGKGRGQRKGILWPLSSGFFAASSRVDKSPRDWVIPMTASLIRVNSDWYSGH